MSNELIVERRFNDFLWLHDQISTAFAGCIIPPVPEKQGVGRFIQDDQDFIETRRRYLEIFMNRLLSKVDILMNSYDLKVFLETERKEFQKIKDFVKKDNPVASVINIVQSKITSFTQQSTFIVII